jgi:biofilm PGA synthesis N-glycosyltransferase PgaC
LLFYALVGLFIFLGFYVTPNKKNSGGERSFISIVVPFRNEQENLPTLIESLKKLHYPTNLFEIIFVNDHSTDNGSRMINESGLENYKLIHSKTEGKKAAVAEGVSIASGTIIASTDADCIVPPHWLDEINHAAENSMILGPVQFDTAKKFIHQFQEIEFAALQAIGASTANWKMPILNNGANMAYKKINFDESSLKKETASGDDIFLLDSFRKKKLPVYFLWNVNSIVKTKPVDSFKQLVEQKVRWASKSKYYKGNANTGLGILIAIVNFLVLMNYFNFFLFNESSNFSLMVLITKLIVDLIFILPYLILIRKPQLVLLLPVFITLYPFYFFYVLLLSIRGKYSWKERNYRA